MTETRHIWRVWADALHRWGMGELAASWLEATGPLNVLGAQFVYLGQPLLSQSISPDFLAALAHMLEDTAETKAFVHFLREAAHSGSVA